MKKEYATTALSLSLVAIVSGFTFLSIRKSAANPSPIPNLVGTWKVDTVGATILHSDQYSPKSHHTKQFSTLQAEAIIQRQEGRRFIGIFKSPRYTEKIAGVISPDGKEFFYVDEDGFLDGKIINPNKMEVVYRHISKSESVVASGTYTRLN